MRSKLPRGRKLKRRKVKKLKAPRGALTASPRVSRFVTGGGHSVRFENWNGSAGAAVGASSRGRGKANSFLSRGMPGNEEEDP